MFDHNIILKAKEHARDLLPIESCGIIVDNGYVDCLNIAEEPEKDFKIDPKVYLKYERKSGVQAIIHSHPNGERINGPSKLDMERQIDTAVPWGIIVVKNGQAQEPFWFGDQMPIVDYIDREFIHGVWDCYGLVRDWYKKELDIVLPYVPRRNNWWEKGENLLEEGFGPAGFINVGEPEYGDVILGKVLGKVPNHAAIYIGNGLILHHLYARLSRLEPIFGWRKYLTHVLRYKGK